MAESNHKRIFLVEDDVDLVDMLTSYLGAQGYEVEAATWGEEAVERISSDLPDVVILDIRLPDIDGYEVCRRLRYTRRTRDLPVIFLTERREREDILAGLALGAVDYITKPFDILELRLRIRNALRRSRMQTLHNPITGLPEGLLVQERLEALLQEPDWALVLATIRGLDSFRDSYGFVAADDVTRAVGLMIGNALGEGAGDGDGQDELVGHTAPVTFAVATLPNTCKELLERCRRRLLPSVQYFYPALARQELGSLPLEERLSIDFTCLTSEEGRVASLEELSSSLQKKMA